MDTPTENNKHPEKQGFRLQTKGGGLVVSPLKGGTPAPRGVCVWKDPSLALQHKLLIEVLDKKRGREWL